MIELLHSNIVDLCSNTVCCLLQYKFSVIYSSNEKTNFHLHYKMYVTWELKSRHLDNKNRIRHCDACVVYMALNRCFVVYDDVEFPCVDLCNFYRFHFPLITFLAVERRQHWAQRTALAGLSGVDVITVVD